MELENTWQRIEKLSWAFIWRAGLMWVVLALVLMPAVELLSLRLGVSRTWVDRILKILPYLIGVCTPHLTFRWLLGRKLGDFRLILASPPPSGDKE